MVSYKVNLLILVILLSFVFNLSFVQASLDINFTNPTPFSGEIVYGDLLINITFSTADNATVYLFNSTRDQINTSFSTTSSHTANFSNLSSGVYYFNATATNSSSDMNSTLTRNIVLVNSNLTGDGSVKSAYKINESRFGNGSELSGDSMGYSITEIGDLNGDGVQDLAVGAPLDDDGDADTGVVWILFLNTTGGVDSEYKINESRFGEQDNLNGSAAFHNYWFGGSVANLGDLNGDGVQDLAVGAETADEKDLIEVRSVGVVWILFLNTTGGVDSEYKINESRFGNGSELESGASFGSSVANIGDLNGDGVQDIAVGEEGNDDGGTDDGAVWILFLNTTGGVDSEYKINESRFGNGNELDGDKFGGALANIGDLNNDGVVDIAVGESLNDDGGISNGAVWILFLNTTGGVDSEYKINESRFGNGSELTGSFPQFGTSITNVGDLNGDGVQDLAVGAMGMEESGDVDGAVWILFLNTTGGVDSEYKINETNLGINLTNDALANSITNLGDLDNDGIVDLAVGEHNNDDGGNQNGAVWILFLNSTDTTAPNLDITFPTVNNTNHSSNDIDINYTRSDSSGLDSCWYSNDTYTVNTTLASCANITGITWSGGKHNLTIYANDTLNNLAFETISFTIDLTNPDINITSPAENGTSSTDNGLDIEFTVSDDIGLDSCWYSNDSYSVNRSTGCGINLTNLTWSLGEHNLTIYVNDSAGNLNFSSISFTISEAGGGDGGGGGGGGGGGSTTTTKKNETEEQEEEKEEETEEEIEEEEEEEIEEEEFVCGEWSECNAVYSIDDLGKEEISLRGEKVRICSNGEIEEIQRSGCSVAKEIEVIKKEKNEVEVFDEEGELVAGLKLFEEAGVEKLDLVLFFEEIFSEGSSKGSSDGSSEKKGGEVEESEDEGGDEISSDFEEEEIGGEVKDEEGFFSKMINYPIYFNRIGNGVVFPIAFF